MPDKWIIWSKSFWGLIVTAIALYMNARGVQWDPGEQADLVTHGEGVLAAALSFLGAVVILWGWLTAKTNLTVLPLLAMCSVLACGLGPMEGCHAGQRTPVAQLTIATQTYTAALKSIGTYRELGQIDDPTILKIESARKIAASALDQAKTAIDNGDSATAMYISAFQAAVDKLVQFGVEAQMQAKKPPPHVSMNGNGGLPARAIFKFPLPYWLQPPAQRFA